MRHRLARLRRPAAIVTLTLATAACGLQQVGVEGAVSAGPAGQGSDTLVGAPGAAGEAATGTAGGTVGTGAGATGTGGSLSGASGGGTGSTGGGTTGGTVTGGTTGGTGGGTASGSGGQATAYKGLSGKLNVGFIAVVGFQDIAKTLNISVAGNGDPVAQTRAMADYVNKRGGIGGKQMVPYVREYNAQQASASNDEAVCTEFADDRKVFAAVLHGQIHHEARTCYKNKKVLAIEGANYGFGKAFYDSHAPYYWAPNIADYDSVARTLVRVLQQRNWFAGDKLAGVVRWDDPSYGEVFTKTLKPGLERAGVTTVIEAKVSNEDIASIQTGLSNAIQTFNRLGVKRVFFLGSPPLQPFFFETARGQRASFTYSMTSFDSPRYQMEKYDDQMKGALGIGFSPSNDLRDPQHPYPQPGLEKTCHEIYKSYGIEFKSRIDDSTSTRQSMNYCETTLLLKFVADRVQGELTPEAWTAEAEKVGTAFQLAMTFTTNLRAGNHTGATSYRVMQYDAACGCNKYVSGNQAFQ